MTTATRWLAPVALAVGLGFVALSPQAQAQDSLTRVLVNVADVVMRGSTPYYRYGNNGYGDPLARSEEHTSELQSLMRISYAVFCLQKKKKKKNTTSM